MSPSIGVFGQPPVLIVVPNHSFCSAVGLVRESRPNSCCRSLWLWRSAVLPQVSGRAQSGGRWANGSLFVTSARGAQRDGGQTDVRFLRRLAGPRQSTHRLTVFRFTGCTSMKGGPRAHLIANPVSWDAHALRRDLHERRSQEASDITLRRMECATL